MLSKLYILAGSLSVPIAPPDQSSRFIFKKAGTCFSLANLKLYVLSAAIACHYMLGKHATSTTNETYRHLSAYLNVEMWILHFQSVHQGKKMIWSSDWHKTYIALALPGRPRANYDSQKNWAGSLRDWARMRTPRICMDPTNLQAD